MSKLLNNLHVNYEELVGKKVKFVLETEEYKSWCMDISFNKSYEIIIYCDGMGEYLAIVDDVNEEVIIFNPNDYSKSSLFNTRIEHFKLEEE